MKKKFWLILLTAVSALCLSLGLTACDLLDFFNQETPNGQEQEQEQEPESEQLTAEQWEAAFSDEAFNNYKAEWTINGEAEGVSPSGVSSGTLGGSALAIREGDKIYLKKDVTFRLEGEIHQLEDVEQYTVRSGKDVYDTYVKTEDGAWEIFQESAVEDGPFLGGYLVFMAMNFETVYDTVCLPFGDGSFEYSMEKHGYVSHEPIESLPAAESVDSTFILKFKEGKLDTVSITMKASYVGEGYSSTYFATAECRITYGGQSLALPSPEEEPEEPANQNLTYQLNEDLAGYTVTGAASSATLRGALVIPAEYDELPVTAIGEEAFASCVRLTSVVIPDSVTSIGDNAFAWCVGLTRAVIGSGVTSIGSDAFWSCFNILEVWNHSDLPIDPGSSEYGGVAQQAKHVYTGNEKGCQTAYDGFLFYEEGEEHFLLGYVGDKTDLTLPQKSPSGSDYSIYSYAFSMYTELTSVTIPEGVTSIGGMTFIGCGLTSVVIGSGVTSIGEGAFYECAELKTVYYLGTAEAWKTIVADGSDTLSSAAVYCFTEDAPTADEWAEWDFWWHYDPDTNAPTPWEK